MITNAFLYIILGIVQFIIGLFPAYAGLPVGLDNGLTWFFNTIKGVADFVPVGTVLTIVKLTITIEMGILLFRFFAWMFKWNITTHHTNEA